MTEFTVQLNVESEDATIEDLVGLAAYLSRTAREVLPLNVSEVAVRNWDDGGGEDVRFAPVPVTGEERGL